MDANERHNTEALEKVWEAAHDVEWAAFKQLFAIPAPSVEAMIYKLDVLVPEMMNFDADDAERVASIRDDADRLLGRSA